MPADPFAAESEFNSLAQRSGIGVITVETGVPKARDEIEALFKGANPFAFEYSQLSNGLAAEIMCNLLADFGKF